MQSSNNTYVGLKYEQFKDSHSVVTMQARLLHLGCLFLAVHITAITVNTPEY
jgi:hypothetical protein